MNFKLLLLAGVAGLSFAAAPAMADTGFAAGDFLVRGRLISVDPVPHAGITTINGHVDADSGQMPEVDFSYFLTDNLSLELIASSTKHNLKAIDSALGASTALGSAWALPPTLTLQYHFDTGTAFVPYVGAGVNYTRWHTIKRASGIDQLKLEDSFGVAAQVGVDYNLGNGWYLNADVKKITITSKATVTTSGTTVHSNAQLNPWVFGIGAGYKF